MRWTAAGMVAIGLLVLALVIKKGPEVSALYAPSGPVTTAPTASASLASASLAAASSPSTTSDRQAAPAAKSEAFEAVLTRVQAALPVQDAFKKQTAEEVHAPPKALADAALALGEVAEAVAGDPALLPRAREFYRECALGNHPNTIRAFCLARASQHEPGHAEPAWASGLAPSVRELAKKVRF